MSEHSSSKYRLIFENAPIGIVHFDKTGKLTDCNDQFVKILGSSKEKLVGIDLPDLPDQRVSDAVKKALNGENGQYEGHYRSITSGNVIPVRAQFTPLIEGEQTVGGIGLIEDISEQVSLHRMLTKFRLGINRSSNPIYITDTDGYIQYVNPAFEMHYGFTSEEVLGKTPRILKSGKQRDDFYKDFWEKITTGESAEGELINRTKEGELVNVHYSANPIIDENGEHLGYIAIQDNITDRVEMEQKIRESLKEKNVMLSEIHHRVKNNLAIISSLLELETFESNDEQTLEFIRKSQTRIKSIAIVHEKIYRNSNLSKVNLKDYIKDLFAAIREAWINDDMSVAFRMDVDDVDININQAIPLSLIIHELVTNSIKHAFKTVSEGVIFIDVSERNGSVHCVISDNGDAIKEDDEFDIDQNQKLGLSLVQLLTKQLSGSLEYEVDGGLVFRIEFKKMDKSGAAENLSEF
ncbi:PAS domain S-box protein [Rhodohalobacter sp. SW132]|uniref:PAS domain S-box protein n=1 Tax=Rhodohalobacter sp. SW132 TaxID=2293433 RepID=UPI001315218A|nr:PAS domain S-box protein [Rhodohalobacter sp. SW132]